MLTTSICNAIGFAVAAYFWRRSGLANSLLGLSMAGLAVLNASLAGAALMVTP